MSVRTPLSQIRHVHRAARTRRTGTATRHEWTRELELIGIGLLLYFGVRAVTIDRAAVARAHARSVVHLELILTGAGLTDTVRSYSHAYRVLQPPSLVDLYAALPRLHLGWDLLVGLTLARFHPRVLARIVGALMPIAMALAVVVTANHYVLDVIVGGLVAMTGLVIAGKLIRARDLRAQRFPADAFRDGATCSTHHC
jgi:hypothetical protein